MSSTDTNDPLLSLPYRTNEPSITLKYPLNSYELKNAGELRKTLEDTYQVSYVPSKADVGRMIIEGSVLDEKERQEILATAYNTLVQHGICPIGQASELIWLKVSLHILQNINL